ncbi:MAG: Si-specific NAD(P)(+) transhydrogenase [Thermodesulfobacteriota bacterium]
MKKYDVLVIGSGPGGEKAAIQAAKLGKSVAIVEREPYIGGAGIHTGTIPSKTLRETAMFLADFRQRAVFGFQYSLSSDVTLSELMYKKTDVIRRQMEVTHSQLGRNNVDIIYGEGSFVDEHNVSVRLSKGGTVEIIEAGVIIIATGTRPARPANVPFESLHIHDTDSILGLKKLPGSLTIIGAGVIGCEYACIFAALGVKVTLVEKRPRILRFADEEITTSLTYWMRHSGVTMLLDEKVVEIKVEGRARVQTELASGKLVISEQLLYTMGRTGNTDALKLENIGLTAGPKGLLEVNESFQTSIPTIYAVGDVIGFPSLAATSLEQGRLAVCNAFPAEGASCEMTGLMPLGIYTIPEISMVGANEAELSEQGVSYETGRAYFEEVARGQITGDIYGMVKLLFHRDTHKLLGVHIVGEKASELIHTGQAVMNFGGTIDYFKDTVFNYPTLSDAYKVAAMNGLNKL